jgi:hypothetical protein
MGQRHLFNPYLEITIPPIIPPKIREIIPQVPETKPKSQRG